jgi:hypothetical protein
MPIAVPKAAKLPLSYANWPSVLKAVSVRENRSSSGSTTHAHAIPALGEPVEQDLQSECNRIRLPSRST